jgi:WhiB family redox-sensing transcriptional regulator
MRGPWEYENPSCASVGGEFWFPERSLRDDEITLFSYSSPEVLLAKSVCNSCIHKKECMQWGLEHERFGIWGGLTEGEREPIRKQLNMLVEEVGIADFTASVGNSSHEGYTST